MNERDFESERLRIANENLRNKINNLQSLLVDCKSFAVATTNFVDKNLQNQAQCLIEKINKHLQ